MPAPDLTGKTVNLQKIADDADWISKLEPFALTATGLASPAVYKLIGGIDETQIDSILGIPRPKQISDATAKLYETAQQTRHASVAKTSKIAAGIGGGLTAIFSVAENILKARYGISSTERAVINIATDTLLASGSSWAGSAIGTTIVSGLIPFSGSPIILGATTAGLTASLLYWSGTHIRDLLCEQADFY